MAEKKIYNYWKNWDNVEAELKQAIEENGGEFPSQVRLQENGKSGLSSAITIYHGGFPAIRKRMGYAFSEKPKGYWKNWDNIEAELKQAIEENGGEFPTQKRLQENGKSGLVRAITEYYDGIGNVREKMGYAQVTSNDQFMHFLEQDETARNLASLVVLNGQGGYDIEKVIVELYGNQFSNHPDLHKLLKENKNPIRELIEKGITNLGAYIGDYDIGEKTIIPILIGQALTEIPDKVMTTSLEDRLFRSLRSVYSPRFNENPEITLTEVREKVDSTKGKEKSMYQKLQTHYENVISLGGKLNA